jgi:hypothetical protein
MTRAEMLALCDVTEEEADLAIALFDLLRPSLKLKANGRIDTSVGDKTPLGLLRTIQRLLEEGTLK